MADFKALTREEQLTTLNNHLTSIKGLSGRLEDNFKSGMMDFSYSLLKKNADALGIVVDGKNYVAYAAGDEPPQQDIVKQTSEDLVKSQQTLTAEEIAFVKDLYAKSQLNNEQQFFVNDKPMLVVPVMTGKKKTTGISVYVEQWERWSAFKQKYNMYSGTDLLAMALDEFMANYDDTDE